MSSCDIKSSCDIEDISAPIPRKFNCFYCPSEPGQPHSYSWSWKFSDKKIDLRTNRVINKLLY